MEINSAWLSGNNHSGPSLPISRCNKTQRLLLWGTLKGVLWTDERVRLNGFTHFLAWDETERGGEVLGVAFSPSPPIIKALFWGDWNNRKRGKKSLCTEMSHDAFVIANEAWTASNQALKNRAHAKQWREHNSASGRWHFPHFAWMYLHIHMVRLCKWDSPESHSAGLVRCWSPQPAKSTVPCMFYSPLSPKACSWLHRSKPWLSTASPPPSGEDYIQGAFAVPRVGSTAPSPPGSRRYGGISVVDHTCHKSNLQSYRVMPQFCCSGAFHTLSNWTQLLEQVFAFCLFLLTHSGLSYGALLFPLLNFLLTTAVFTRPLSIPFPDISSPLSS